MSIASRVASRYLAAALGMGQTFQNEKVRIHRYRDSFRVTDLRNAGKRGKKVPEMAIMLTRAYTGDVDQWFDIQAKQFLDYAKSSDPYAKIRAYIKDLLVDYPKDIDLQETMLRGVDVEPFGEVYTWKFQTSDIDRLEAKVSPQDFSVRSTHTFTGPKGNLFDQDTLYYPRDKKSSALFYGWLKDNLAKAKKMGMTELRQVWEQLGVKYDSQ